jgi:hypothetical protein
MRPDAMSRESKKVKKLNCSQLFPVRFCSTFMIEERGGAVGYGTALQNRQVVGSIPDGVIGIFH